MSRKSTQITTQKKLVILGGGIGGLALSLAIENDKKLSSSLDVVLIDKKDYFEVNLASVRFLVDPGTHSSFTGPYDRYLKKTKFVCGEARTVHAQPQQVDVTTASGVEHIPYDYLVLALGTRYAYFKGEVSTLAARTEEITQHALQVRNAAHVLIVGGRSVGVEILGEILASHPTKEVTIVHSGNVLMDEWPKSGVAKLAKFTAKHKNLHVVLQQKVVRSDGNRHELSDGSIIEADMKITATGVLPNSEPLRQFFTPALSPNGYVKVLNTLQVEGYGNIFAIGDIADLDMPKMAANLKGHIETVHKNLLALLHNKSTVAAPGPMMNFPGLVTLGPLFGILALPIFGGSSFSGKMISNLKTNMFTKIALKGS